ncbi:MULTISPECIES: cobyrinate a,c-diamide synthase [Massilia]|uniref:Cobyrinic acid a,c-diamide synthase n=1 Tax=Massilia aurea TaxID=373040 RepID=A0A422QEH7_9BURK|nr:MULTISPECIES: cobyrinate a,c-diamide synthase [Massilia]MDY0965604.1 cobyrinate a,c-diamide synthase [Massilia sp. CFBP9026]RNF28370.1 cobyrinic acid a,c-diamide synthase [Massilia aurea]
MVTGARIALVAAMSSGQGKTTVTAALARRLVRMGKRVRVFKCGPDFIDPMLLERACGAPVHNLDLWMVGVDACRQRLADAAHEADAILVEGVMGLYDGSPSAADLSREFGIPVLAVLDASAMAQTAGAVAQGLRDYGPVEMAGVIANRVASSGHAAMVKESLRDIPLIGTLARQDEPLPERHLGLVVPGEVEELDRILDALADSIDFDEAAWDALPVLSPSSALPAPVEPLLAGRTIAIARDPSFVFVYPANIDVLEQLGARITYFAPLSDEAVPDDADAVYLPGGYPELHGAQLQAAQRWRDSIRDVHARGVPIVAECGGMMALADGLTDSEGRHFEMAGLLAGEVRMQKRLGGLGMHAMPTPQGDIRGHTFHYSLLDSPVAPQAHTVKQRTGTQGEAAYRVGSLFASYFHGYFPSNPRAVAVLFGAQP